MQPISNKPSHLPHIRARSPILHPNPETTTPILDQKYDFFYSPLASPSLVEQRTLNLDKLSKFRPSFLELEDNKWQPLTDHLTKKEDENVSGLITSLKGYKIVEKTLANKTREQQETALRELQSQLDPHSDLRLKLDKRHFKTELRCLLFLQREEQQWLLAGYSTQKK